MKQSINLFVDVQNTLTQQQNDHQTDLIPNEIDIKNCLTQALLIESEHSNSHLLAVKNSEIEVTIRIVNKDEIQSLNQIYRNKNKPTNVLSFPYEAPEFDLSDLHTPEMSLTNLLGDIIICHDVLIDEAKQQDKKIQDHWTHMIIHGLLHLKGYDHIDTEEADIMENLEIKILSSLDISNPYH